MTGKPGKTFAAARAQVVVIALLALSVVGCSSTGEADPPDTDATAAPVEATGAPEDQAAAEAECNIPDGLLDRLGLERQLVLNLAMAEGSNLEDVQSLGGPEPDTFRSVADVLDGLDLSGVEPRPNFDEPDDIVADLRETADLLEAALAAGTDTTDPAWRALTEFYTQDFFIQHNASINYYLDEAGCA